MLTHPDQLGAVQADRSLLPQAIEEGLRIEPPLLTHQPDHDRARWSWAACTIGPGESITTHIGSANHDETRWDDPENFDIFRPPQPHIAFAHGPHMCLGMHLARLETRALAQPGLRPAPGPRPRPGTPTPYIRGDVFRSPTALPVRFSAAGHLSPPGDP